MRIGIDVDGVLADFNLAYMSYCVRTTGKDLFGENFVIREWNYPETQAGYTKEEVAHVWEVIKSHRNFWASLNPLPYASHALEQALSLQDRDAADIYFITSRVGYRAKEQTEKWLRMMGFPNPTVLICHDKGSAAQALNLSHYIDDKPENVMSVKVLHPNCQTYLQTQTWNEACVIPGVTRARSAVDFLLDTQKS